MNPTASAVVGDVIELSSSILAGAVRRTAPLGYMDDMVGTLPIKPIGEIVSKYYLRFSAVDKPGVLAKIAGALGVHNLRLESMIQQGRSTGESVPIVLLTHEAKEREIRAALAEIDGFDVINGKSILIRIEDNLE